MSAARLWLCAAGAFFLMSGYWFVSFLIAAGDPVTGSSNAWMLVFACAFSTIGISLALQSRRR